MPVPGVRALLPSAWRAAVWTALRVLPPRPHAVVAGWPDTEGNALEVLRALTRRYPGRIYWLVDDPACRVPAFAREEVDGSGRVVRVRKSSARGVRLALTARVIFFTHGMYVAVPPPRNRLVVNLWHGDGVKKLQRTELVRSTVTVSGSRLWAPYKAEVFDVPEGGTALVGNPRVDQFDEPLEPAELARLGLDPAARRVLWMPTFREARGPRSQSWSDGERFSRNDDVAPLARQLQHLCASLDLELLIKPHPLDADSYTGLGVRVVTNAELDDAGVSLYQLLGSCSALISDISSVWVDYLVLDRPIGFYIPDLEELAARRGLNIPDFEDVLPGERIETPAAAAAFLARVAAGDPGLRPSAYAGAARVGVPPSGQVADRLLDWLTVFELARSGRAPFAPAAGSTFAPAAGSTTAPAAGSTTAPAAGSTTAVVELPAAEPARQQAG